MNWLEVLFSWFNYLWPLRVVRSYQQGVRFWWGRDTKELGPGVYAFLPFFGDIEIVTVVPDVLDMGVHSITTTDNRKVTFSANIAYEIVSARLMWTKVQDFETSLQRIAEGHLATKIRDWSYDDLITGQKELERSLRGTLETRAKKWGVLVIDVWITDLVECKQFRLFGGIMG